VVSVLGWSFISSINTKVTMTTLFRRIKPYSFPITLDLIAKFLHIPKSLLVRAECWAYVLFVHRCDKGGQFISYRKLAMWIEAVVSLIKKALPSKTFGKSGYRLNKSAKSLTTKSLSWNTYAVSGQNTETISETCNKEVMQQLERL
jgi:hypothetical protein